MSHSPCDHELISQSLPKDYFPEKELSPRVAYELIHNELKTQKNPETNMASFVTTDMDDECNRLIIENLGVNYIDTEVYRTVSQIHERCILMLGDLFHAPKKDRLWGTEAIGSSEALMLCGLSHKRAWQKRAKRERAQPNIVMGNNVHVTWDKFAEYFDVEKKAIPLEPGRYTISADQVKQLVDENTICVVAVLETSYTFQNDPVEEINNALLEIKQEKGWDIPLHVDGASGGFVAPFLSPHLKWDFRLEQVQTINVSGHKFGLVYPGIGWAIWKDASAIPEELFIETNVLGFNEKTFNFNFSRGSSMILAQYYNFIRLGRQGYTEILHGIRENARYLAAKIKDMNIFELINDASMTPALALTLKADKGYTVYDLSALLAQRGWTVPAFSLPPHAESVDILRIVCKQTFSRGMADILFNDLVWAVETAQANTKKNLLSQLAHYKKKLCVC